MYIRPDLHVTHEPPRPRPPRCPGQSATGPAPGASPNRIKPRITHMTNKHLPCGTHGRGCARGGRSLQSAAATMSRTRGPGCAGSTPSMHHARSVASAVRCRRAPARAPGRTDEAGSTRTDECMHVHASRLSDALTLDEQRTHACYAGRARGASAALPLGRSAACRWNHPKRPAAELTQTERWCPLSVAWKRAACSAACSRGARWVEAAGGTPRTSRECACITWCSFSAGATNADTNAAPSLQRTRIVAERERVGFMRSHAYHRQAERSRELRGAAAAAADRLLTCTARRTPPTAEVKASSISPIE